MIPRDLAVALLILVSGCSPGIHVRQVDVNARQSPLDYATYRWVPTLLQEGAAEEIPDVQYSRAIRAEIDRALAHSGYLKVDDDESAMIVDFQLTVKKSEAYESLANKDQLDETLRYGLRWRLPTGDKPLRIERMTPEEEILYLEEGTLHIAVFSPDRMPLWHSMGHKLLDPSHTLEEHQVVLEESVAKMLARFPSRY